MDRPPHVLHVVEEFPPRDRLTGGVRVSIRFQIEELARRCPITLLEARPKLPPLARYEEARRGQALAWAADDADATYRIVRREYRHWPLLWPVTEPWQLASLVEHVRRTDAARTEIVHGHRAYPMGAAAVIAARRAGVPAVITAHGSDVHTHAVGGDARVRYWTRWALRRASCVIPVSDELRHILLRLGIPDARIRHIPNGVDLARFGSIPRDEARRTLGLPPDRPIVLSIGNLVPVKGHGTLLDAVPRMRRLRHDLLVVLGGEGPLRAELEARARGLGIAEAVRFAGALPYDSIPVWMAAADVFALPSWNEGTPLTALEALASRRPVVGTAVGGTADVVTPEVGILVPAGDAESLADAILAAIDRRWDPATLRARSERYAWPRIAEEILEVYERIRHRPTPPA